MPEENKIALVGIIVENLEATAAVNSLLHEFGAFVIGRMGLPYRERGVAIISIVLDAPPETVSALSGKLGMIKGIKVKSIQAKV